MSEQFTLEYYQQSADYIRSKINERPEIAIILGTALGGLADEIEDKVVIDYREIPNFLRSTAPSHAGKLIFGKLSGRNVMCMAGRFHYYEGYSFAQLAQPVRVMKLLGVEKLIVTNAAGSVNKAFNVGDIMIISDHINLVGASPMRGVNVVEMGERFFDVTEAYSPRLRAIASAAAERLEQKYRTHEGVYFYCVGPHFETPAEIRAIRTLGGDAVGMSTVTEALTAAHCGIETLGLSLMTNMAAGVLPQKLSGEEVEIAGREAAGRFKALVREIVKEM